MKLLLFVASVAVLFSLVPLITWAVTGRRDRALQAARQYGEVMAWLTVPVVLFVGITHLLK